MNRFLEWLQRQWWRLRGVYSVTLDGADLKARDGYLAVGPERITFTGASVEIRNGEAVTGTLTGVGREAVEEEGRLWYEW